MRIMLRMMTPPRYIRERVFGLNQRAFGRLLDVHQTTVHRWEASGRVPAQMQPRIRMLARERALEWSDTLFFETPPQTMQAEEAA